MMMGFAKKQKEVNNYHIIQFICSVFPLLYALLSLTLWFVLMCLPLAPTAHHTTRMSLPPHYLDVSAGGILTIYQQSYLL